MGRLGIFVIFAIFSVGVAQEFRLPRNILPTSYKLEIISVLDEIPQFPRFSAPGKVWIRFDCVEATDVIKLHVLDLDINEGGIYVHNSVGVPQSIRGFGSQPEYNFFLVNLTTALVAGESYELYIPYTAPISPTRLDGIYLDSYVDPATSETKYVSTTLFAANNARRAFPCLDEPDLKAVFEISLGHHAKYHALSNAHLLDTNPLPEIATWILDTFAPTPRMSPYLVCMIVSDLTYSEAPQPYPDAAIHRVYAPYYFIDRGGGVYSANLSSTVNAAFESYYNISYPMSKLDNVALPQFYYTAMENWGLMTFADRALLYFEGETSAVQKYSLSLTVSHEVSHNFFGNIVTCKWWTWIWLNEGWATFASHQGLQMTYPELRPWDMFIPQIYQTAMAMDESLNTHPVASEPLTPDAIGGIYDDIVYEKAATLIRMMQNFVTEPILQEGVRRYLQKWQYGVTEQDDLFLEIQGALDDSGQGSTLLPPSSTIKGIMDTWTLQAGYPLVTVWRVSPTQIQLSQRQHVRNEIPSGDEVWWVPVNLNVLTGPSPGRRKVWLANDGVNLTLNVGEDELFFVNPESIGYFRVMYGSEMLHQWARLLEMDHTKLTPTMRAKLLDDSFQLAFSGHIPIDAALDLTKYLNQEVDFLVWKSVEKSLTKLGNLLRSGSDKTGQLFNDYVSAKISYSRSALQTQRAMMDAISVDYLDQELTRLGPYFTLGDESSPSVKSTVQEIDSILKPGQEMVNLEQVQEKVRKIGQNEATRGTTWDLLTERILSVKENPGATHALMSLLEQFCPFGNSDQDLVQVNQFITSTRRMSFTRKHQSILTSCDDTIKKNIHAKAKLGPLVKSWLIKRR
ncbi:aminopeptidase Ey [Folsomia candida]|uniref:Aminopeptidase n=1 Tax=Folsomia candida TaxID=158441 RepID=A0A226CYD7_FOLCA|nr:aminopeptidase Ey [Folsomia candida]OXA37624.1 Aminopeptidase N [Folsomia candida]